MKNKICGICLREFPTMWKAKTRDKPQMCRQCALKGSVQIGDLKISNKTFSETQTNKEYKSIPELLKLATMVFNKWIRNRDSKDGYFTDISSGDYLPISQMDAGHFYPVSTSSALRFNEDNVHGESISKNRFDPYHLKVYRENLIKKIGLERVEWLDAHKSRTWKPTKEEMLDIIKKYK